MTMASNKVILPNEVLAFQEFHSGSQSAGYKAPKRFRKVWFVIDEPLVIGGPDLQQVKQDLDLFGQEVVRAPAPEHHLDRLNLQAAGDDPIENRGAAVIEM